MKTNQRFIQRREAKQGSSPRCVMRAMQSGAAMMAIAKRILLGLVLLAAPAAAQIYAPPWYYSINSPNTNTITIQGYTGPGGAVIIPTSISNLLVTRSEEHTSELQSLRHLVCRLLL